MGIIWEAKKVTLKVPIWVGKSDITIIDFDGGFEQDPRLPKDPTNISGDPGWRSWITRDIIGYFFLGMLVPLPQMTIMSAARLMFPGITGTFGMAFAVPAAIVSYSLPFFAYHISYNIVVIVNITIALLSLISCTLGTSLAGPVIGTIFAGTGAATGQYLYLAVAAFYDKRTVITFSIGTRVIFVVRAAMYMGLMAAFHDDWRLSIRVITPLPLLHGLVYWLVLSPGGRAFAEETRMCTSADHEAEDLRPVEEEKSQIVCGIRGSVVLEEPPSPKLSLFSYPGSFQIPSTFLSLHPDIDQQQSIFDDVLQRFGYPADQDEERDRIMPIRPPTPMFGRLLSLRSTHRSRSHCNEVSRQMSTRSTSRTLQVPMKDRIVPTSILQSSGFSQGRSKTRLLWMTVIPHYAIPLAMSVSGSMIAMTGLAPAFLYLNTFKLAPKGDLNYQLNTFASGLAAVLFASFSLYKYFPYLYTIGFLQISVIIIGITQLFRPFLKYFPVWLVFAFLTGGFEGAAVTNTNFKIARDFEGEKGEVRSFAMSFGALGNFVGDVFGGGVAVGVQIAGERFLKVQG